MSGYPVALVIGGPPGSGKTTAATRLATELRLPHLGSDTIGRIIQRSQATQAATVDAYWLAYDVVFGLCADFLRAGVSTILDLNLGWTFQWQQLDKLRAQHPTARILPVLLRCPRALCLARLQERHESNPVIFGPPECFTANPQIMQTWDFIERIDRPDVRIVDAARSHDAVYAELHDYLVGHLTTIRLGAIALREKIWIRRPWPGPLVPPPRRRVPPSGRDRCPSTA